MSWVVLLERAEECAGLIEKGTEQWNKKAGRRSRVRSWVEEQTEAESVKGVGIRSREPGIYFLRKEATYQLGFR